MLKLFFSVYFHGFKRGCVFACARCARLCNAAPTLSFPVQRVTLQRMGVGEAYSVVDLARLLWACATLGVSPRAGLINSFAGGGKGCACL